MAFTAVLTMGRILVATYFIAQLGKSALAVLAICTAVIETAQAATLGLLSGTSLLVARHREDGHATRQLFYASMLVGIVLGIFLTFAYADFTDLADILHLPIGPHKTSGSPFGESTASILDSPHITPEPRVDAFMEVYAYGAFAYCIYMVAISYLLGMQKATFLTASSALGFLLSVTLTYLLVFGELGLPAMGIMGFAWAVVLSNWVVLLITLGYLGIYRRALGLGAVVVKGLFEWKIYRRLFELGVPFAMLTAAEVLFMAVIVFMLHDYSLRELAAYQVVWQIFSVTVMWTVSVSEAAAVVASRVWQDSKISIVRLFHEVMALSVLSALAAAVGLLLFKRPLLGEFFTQPETIDLATRFLYAAVAILLSQSVVAALLGILRGLHHARSLLAVVVASFALVGVPLLFVVRYCTDLPGVALLWVLFVSSTAMLVVFALRLYWSGHYRDAARLVRLSRGSTGG